MVGWQQYVKRPRKVREVLRGVVEARMCGALVAALLSPQPTDLPGGPREDGDEGTGGSNGGRAGADEAQVVVAAANEGGADSAAGSAGGEADPQSTAAEENGQAAESGGAPTESKPADATNP